MIYISHLLPDDEMKEIINQTGVELCRKEDVLQTIKILEVLKK